MLMLILDPRVLDLRYNTPVPRRSDSYSCVEVATHRPFEQEFMGSGTDFGFNDVVRQAQVPSQHGLGGNHYGQAGFTSPYSGQLRIPGQSIEAALPRRATSPTLPTIPPHTLETKSGPRSRDATMPANLVRLSHACFLGTIPLPDSAFHAPGGSISDKTVEVLKRPLPDYNRRASSIQNPASTGTLGTQTTSTTLRHSAFPDNHFHRRSLEKELSFTENPYQTVLTAGVYDHESYGKVPSLVSSSSPPHKKAKRSAGGNQ
jgi:hypothetical protein